MKSKIFAGFNISCVGDDRAFSLPSRKGNTISDYITACTQVVHPKYVRYSWLDRGSDERQYCAPGIDLPIASICLTKYGEHPYIIHLDILIMLFTNYLNGGYEIIKTTIEATNKTKNIK